MEKKEKGKQGSKSVRERPIYRLKDDRNQRVEQKQKQQKQKQKKLRNERNKTEA